MKTKLIIFSNVDGTAVYNTYYFTVLMQLAVALNRLSAVAAKQKHDEIFSKRNAFLLIFAAIVLAAIGNIPGFIQGLEINPEIMAAWFVTAPSYFETWDIVESIITIGIATSITIIYAVAFILFK